MLFVLIFLFRTMVEGMYKEVFRRFCWVWVWKRELVGIFEGVVVKVKKRRKKCFEGERSVGFLWFKEFMG